MLDLTEHICCQAVVARRFLIFPLAPLSLSGAFLRPIASPLTVLAARLKLGPTRVSVVGFIRSYYLQSQDRNVFLYLAAVLLLQRMFGRTMPWYMMLYKQNVKEIEADTIGSIPKFLRPLALVFSEAYRSGTIWIIVLAGLTANQIIPIFIYFIAVLFVLSIFMMAVAYRERVGRK